MERDDNTHYVDKLLRCAASVDDLDDIKRLVVTAIGAIEEIEKSNGSPYVKAFQHCLLHVAKGGTLETFKPLLRTLDYAGLDRRQAQENIGMR